MHKSILNDFFDQHSIQFDHPAKLAHSTLRPGTKPVLLCVPSTYAANILVSSEDALGIFFLDKSATVYITRPLYRLLELRLTELQSLLVSYDDEEKNLSKSGSDELQKPTEESKNFKTERQASNYKQVSVISAIKPTVIFISLNAPIEFPDFTILPVPSNTFLGFCNFLIEICNRTIALVSTFSKDQRVSQKPNKKTVDCLIFNDSNRNLGEKERRIQRSEVKNSENLPTCTNEMNGFRTYLYENAKIINQKKNRKVSVQNNQKKSNFSDLNELLKHSTVKLIPVNFSTDFCELLLHVLALFCDCHVLICHPEADSLIEVLNTSGTVVHDKFRVDLWPLVGNKSNETDRFGNKKTVPDRFISKNPSEKFTSITDPRIKTVKSLFDVPAVPPGAIVFCSLEEFALAQTRNATHYWTQVIKTIQENEENQKNDEENQENCERTQKNEKNNEFYDDFHGDFVSKKMRRDKSVNSLYSALSQNEFVDCPENETVPELLKKMFSKEEISEMLMSALTIRDKKDEEKLEYQGVLSQDHIIIDLYSTKDISGTDTNNSDSENTKKKLKKKFEKQKRIHHLNLNLSINRTDAFNFYEPKSVFHYSEQRVFENETQEEIEKEKRRENERVEQEKTQQMTPVSNFLANSAIKTRAAQDLPNKKVSSEKETAEKVSSDENLTDYPYTYVLDTTNVSTLSDHLFLSNLQIERTNDFCLLTSEPLTQNALNEWGVFLDGTYFFKSARLKVEIDQENESSSKFRIGEY